MNLKFKYYLLCHLEESRRYASIRTVHTCDIDSRVMANDLFGLSDQMFIVLKRFVFRGAGVARL